MEQVLRIAYHQYKSRGFTLIETVIAFAVLLAAILGPVALVAFSIGNAYSSQNKLIAINLGQEGIELVRAIRENNIICDTLSIHPPPVAVAWNANPAGGIDLGQGSNTLFTVDANDMISVNGGANCGSTPPFPTPQPTIVAECDATHEQPLYLDLDGIYTHHSGGGSTPTIFWRCVQICVPANSAPCNGANDPDVTVANDQMEVISKVFWTDHGLTKSVQFEERLYNWR